VQRRPVLAPPAVHPPKEQQMTKTMKMSKVVTMRLADLEPHPENPRHMDDKAFEALKASIRRFKAIKIPSWNSRNRKLITGHQTVRALVALGYDRCQINVKNMTEKDHIAAMIADNNPLMMGSYTDALSSLIQRLDDDVREELLIDRLDFVEDALDKMTIAGSVEKDIGDDELKTDNECPRCGYKF
jgi:ParB-like chromosome segregation protein Spo0J